MFDTFRNNGRYAGLLSIGILIGPAATGLLAAQYYFSASGHDQTGDGSESRPWRSVDKFNGLDLEPGDSAFFRVGDQFNGSLILDANDTGTDSNGNLISPIVIDSYGGGPGGRASIRSHPTSEALFAYNSAGIELSNLEFLNGGTHVSNRSSGLQFMLDSAAGSESGHFQHIRISNVVSRGFHRAGLSLFSSSDAGYRDVEIVNSEFYDNEFAGVEISAAPWTELRHQEIRIDDVIAHNNPGFAGCQPHCGHGIVIGQVDGAVIENSVAHSNGIVAGRGNVGIWTWQSNDVTIQRNSAYGNRSPNGGDGGGFDIDGGVTNSVVQYNVSQDNAGAGFLLAEFGFAEPMQQNVFRYNLSVNDGTDSYGSFTISGEHPAALASSALFHNNTAIVDLEVAPHSRGTMWFINSNHDDIKLINNVFVALNGAALIDGSTNVDQVQFADNAYWTAQAPVRIGGVEYASVAEWATATGQEMVNGQFVGLQADPQLDSEGAYRPLEESPLIDAGHPPDGAAWPNWFMSPGPVDLFGTAIPQGVGIDIGAAEFPELPGDYNHDGRVNAADFVVWRKAMADPDSGLLADGNGDGTIDALDFEVWRFNFGQSTTRGAHIAFNRSALSVPEPPGILLTAAIITVIHVGRRKRKLTFIRPGRHVDLRR
jgi:hypothetical protein